jgi:membrane-bound serine protease (ClpP class)
MAIELGEAGFWLRLSRRRRPEIGAEALVGAVGVATTDCRPRGQVRVRGERWQAVCDEGADAGDQVVVEGVSGLTLQVRRK